VVELKLRFTVEVSALLQFNLEAMVQLKTMFTSIVWTLGVGALAGG
jgi:hypothetical protein